MICGCIFSVSIRRHHCRSCGDIICASCSRFKRVLPEFNLLGSVKVCTFCNTDNTVYRESKLLGAWGELIWTVGKTSNGSGGRGIGSGTTSSSPHKVVTFQETISLIPILYEEADYQDRDSVVYNNEDETHHEVTVTVEDMQSSAAEVSCSDAINAEDVHPSPPIPITSTTTAAVDLSDEDGSSGPTEDPLAPTTTTSTSTTNNVTKMDGQVSQNHGDELSSIHDDENSESVDLSQTFGSVLDLNSPGVTSSTIHSVDSAEAKIDFNSENEKSPSIGGTATIISTNPYILLYNTYITYMKPHTYIHLFIDLYVMK